MFKGINWVGVIAALVFAQLLGFLWYGPIFGAQWMTLMGMTEASMSGQSNAMIFGALIGLITMIGLGWALPKMGAAGYMDGAKCGLMIGVFFAGTTEALGFVYGQKAQGLIPIDFGYILLIYLVGGALVAGLRLGKRA